MAPMTALVTTLMTALVTMLMTTLVTTLVTMLVTTLVTTLVTMLVTTLVTTLVSTLVTTLVMTLVTTLQRRPVDSTGSLNGSPIMSLNLACQDVLPSSVGRLLRSLPCLALALTLSCTHGLCSL